MLVCYSNYSIKVGQFGERTSNTLNISFLFSKIKQANSVSIRLPSGSNSAPNYEVPSAKWSALSPFSLFVSPSPSLSPAHTHTLTPNTHSNPVYNLVTQATSNSYPYSSSLLLCLRFDTRKTFKFVYERKMRHTDTTDTQTSPCDEILFGFSNVFITSSHRGSHLPGFQLLKSNLYLLISETLNKSFYLSEPQVP